MRILLAMICAASPLVAEEIGAGQFAQFKGRSVVFLGELHDNPVHHDNQAEAVRVLTPGAVVFEMLTPDKAALITPKLLQDQDRLEAVLDWDNSGWPDFAMYYPIFAASAGAQILGAQVTREAARAAVMGDGVVESFGEDAARFGLIDTLPAEQQEQREALQMAAHCDALPETMLPGMVMVQRLRDATLARAVTTALDGGAGPVVVITGNGHARVDWGVPALLGTEVDQVSIAQLEAAPPPGQPHDHWIITEGVAREDPCKAFR